MSQLFTSDDQTTGASISASVLPMIIQDWFSLRWTDLISLLSKGLQESSSALHFKGINSLVLCLLYGPALTNICDHWEDHNLDYMTFVSGVISLLFNTLPRFVIAFLPSSNRLLISWLQSVHSDFRPQEEEICHYFHPFCLPCSKSLGLQGDPTSLS